MWPDEREDVLYVVLEVLPGFAWKRFDVGLLVGAKGWKSIKFLRFVRTPLLISPSWYGLNFATIIYISDCEATYTVTINNRPEDRLIKGFYASLGNLVRQHWSLWANYLIISSSINLRFATFCEIRCWLLV